MKIVSRVGRDDIAVVYIARLENGELIEFVESVEPPIPRERKWVNIVSTLCGCPVGCAFCDAGIRFRGKLSVEEIMFQIDTMVQKRFPDRNIRCDKWKIQFARMGEPALNSAVLEVLRELPSRYNASGLFPSLSTVAPGGRARFFAELLEIKRELFPQRFQLQFSLHTTDPVIRRELIPVKTWSLPETAAYGERFFQQGGRKITLNFALMENAPVDSEVLLRHFDPAVFLLKVTPLNPTFRVRSNEIGSLFDTLPLWKGKIAELRNGGYTVIESIGELEENAIGSNCGQYVSAQEESEHDSVADFYSYSTEPVD